MMLPSILEDQKVKISMIQLSKEPTSGPQIIQFVSLLQTPQEFCS